MAVFLSINQRSTLQDSSCLRVVAGHVSFKASRQSWERHAALNDCCNTWSVTQTSGTLSMTAPIPQRALWSNIRMWRKHQAVWFQFVSTSPARPVSFFPSEKMKSSTASDCRQLPQVSNYLQPGTTHQRQQKWNRHNSEMRPVRSGKRIFAFYKTMMLVFIWYLCLVNLSRPYFRSQAKKKKINNCGKWGNVLLTISWFVYIVVLLFSRFWEFRAEIFLVLYCFHYTVEGSKSTLSGKGCLCSVVPAHCRRQAKKSMQYVSL